MKKLLSLAILVSVLGSTSVYAAGDKTILKAGTEENIQKNIYKEINSDVGCDIPNNGYLLPWAKQGVFLLNTVMSVEDSKPKSHANKGWEVFTDNVIKKINEKDDPVVFLLWGRDARNKANMISEKHLVLEAAHPSPLSAYNGFFGCKHFSKTNEFLKNNGRGEINWQIPNL